MRSLTELQTVWRQADHTNNIVIGKLISHNVTHDNQLVRAGITCKRDSGSPMLPVWRSLDTFEQHTSGTTKFACPHVATCTAKRIDLAASSM